MLSAANKMKLEAEKEIPKVHDGKYYLNLYVHFLCINSIPCFFSTAHLIFALLCMIWFSWFFIAGANTVYLEDRQGRQVSFVVPMIYIFVI